MDAVVGVFPSRLEGERAAQGLLEIGFTKDQVTMLTPHSSEAEIHSVPTTEAEPPGVGRALGAITGGAAGAATGIQASLLTGLVPGVGPVMVLGAIGALLLGLGGAAIGGALDRRMREGLPKDELYVYEDALRRGRTVVIVLPTSEEQAERTRGLLSAAGAESIDAAREQWWLGLRDAEAAAYTTAGGDFVRDERIYRRGFEAACILAREGASYTDLIVVLRERDPEIFEHEAFRQGFARGRAHIWAREDRRAASRLRKKVQLLRWRPRPHAQRTRSTPRVRRSGAASHLDLLRSRRVLPQPRVWGWRPGSPARRWRRAADRAWWLAGRAARRCRPGCRSRCAPPHGRGARGRGRRAATV